MFLRSIRIDAGRHGSDAGRRGRRAIAGERRRSASASFVRVVLTGATVVLAFAACTTVSPQRRALAEKEQLCTACHGLDGKVMAVSAPVLAGQSKDYLAAQLQAFRDHSRANGDGRFYMWPMAAGLSDAMVDSLAGYFASLPPPQAPAAGASAGRELFDQGAPQRGIAPCSSCHGDKGQGVAAFPRLAGQHRDYLMAQLRAFADESRPNPIMGPMAKNLSAEDIRSVAAYLESL